MTPRDREQHIQAAVAALVAAVLPDRVDTDEALERLLTFVPEDVPPQFTNPKVYPYGPEHFDKKEQAEDAKQPFFSEAYLYTLLGKEDARSLRARMRQFLHVLGYTDERIQEWF